MAEKPEGPRAFARFIEALSEGDVHAELSNELHELGVKLRSTARNRMTTVKGSLVLKLKFAADEKGVVDIEHVIETKVPKPKAAKAMMWLTPGGNMSAENPRQPLLPGIREVSLPAQTARDVDQPPAAKDV